MIWMRKDRMTFVKFGLLLVCTALFFGCGSDSRRPTFPVTGTVKLNGKPVDGAVVTFQLTEGKESAIASTDKDGSYSLSMFRPNDGALAGQYKVSITKFDVEPVKASSGLVPGQVNSGDLPTDYEAPTVGTTTGKGPVGPKNSLPAKYSNPDSSGLRATVEANTKNVFDFDLK